MFVVDFALFGGEDTRSQSLRACMAGSEIGGGEQNYWARSEVFEEIILCKYHDIGTGYLG